VRDIPQRAQTPAVDCGRKLAPFVAAKQSLRQDAIVNAPPAEQKIEIQ
jgi:hypothetical protein